jgi:CHAT domain-containing protein/tetratricopeptide (TPR) repeat protein
MAATLERTKSRRDVEPNDMSAPKWGDQRDLQGHVVRWTRPRHFQSLVTPFHLLHKKALETAHVALLLMCIACTSYQSRKSHSAAGRLARELRGIRTIEPRLSIAPAYSVCQHDASADTTSIQSSECDVTAPISADLGSLAANVANAVRTSPDPQSLQAAATLDLVWAGKDGPIDQPIEYLRMAATLAARPAPILSDLAAAYLVRAGRAHDGRDLAQAIETAAQATELEPTNVTARFNLALALERFGLEDQAHAAWTALAKAEPNIGWRAEIARHLLSEQRPAKSSLPSCDAPTESWRHVAVDQPQATAAWAWDHLLGDWGNARVGDDTAFAAKLLSCARTVGEALESNGRDATLADAVRAILALPRGGMASLALARAHAHYSVARAAYAKGLYAIAEPEFRAALESRGQSKPLRLWATLFHAATLVYTAHPATGEELMRQVIAQSDTSRYPALVGRAEWCLGTTTARAHRIGEAMRAYRNALSLFRRAGEGENHAAIEYLLAESEFNLNDPIGYTSTAHALHDFDAFRGSPWLESLLWEAANAAARDGLFQAASYAHDEEVQVAERTGMPVYVIESHLARARFLNEMGATSRAAIDIGTAQRALARLPDTIARGWFGADFASIRADAALGTHDASTGPLLDSVVGFFSRLRDSARLVPAYVDRADARADAGDAIGAQQDLNRVFALLDREHHRLDSAGLRASVARRARAVIDRLMMLRIEAGRQDEALETLEQDRTYLSPGTWLGPHPTTNRSTPRLRAGEVAIDYAIVGDTLLAWIMTDTSLHFRRTAVSREALLHTIARVRAALEVKAPDGETLPDLTSLDSIFVEPIRDWLPPNAPLVIVADDEIQGVPFAALRDPAHGRFLIEERSIRFAPSLVSAALDPATDAQREVYLIADPAFDARAFPALSRLPGAIAEVEAIAPLYDGSLVLVGKAATSGALAYALEHATVLHYAGHAVLDDRRPDHSRLVLAVDTLSRSGLAASDIRRLHLGNLRLVVLSACRSLDFESGAPSGFAGLSGSFLSAGAGGVVGSLWQVDDRLLQPLMLAFHRAYRRTSNPAFALRSAQLTLLGSDNAALRSPTAWAAFRYTGR